MRQLITDGVITINYVKSSENLVDPLTKGLARDLVWKTSKGMELKPTKFNHSWWKLDSTLETSSS